MGLTSILTGPVGTAIKGIGGGVAGLLGDPKQTTTQNQDSNTSSEQNTNYNNFSNQDFSTWLTNLINNSSNQSGTSTTNFNLDPATQALLAQLTKNYGSVAKPFDTAGYQAGQIQGINNNSNLQSQAVQQIMAARGVTGPAAATAQTGVENQRFGNINQVYTQTPFVKQQFDLSNLGAAASFLNTIPKGTTTSTQQAGNSTQSSNQSGNQVGSSTTGGTGYSSTQGASHVKGTSTAQKGGGVGAGIAGVLAGLFG